MSRGVKILVTAITSVAGLLMFVPTASADTVEKSFNHVDLKYVESGLCSFDLSVHLDGSYKSVNYYDSSGFLYKTINTPGGGGPFTVTYAAHGITLTQRNEAFSELVIYHHDGTWTYTRRGPYAKFTVPGEGVVLLDTGIAAWAEPDDTLLFAHGPHHAVNGDFGAFCAAFG